MVNLQKIAKIAGMVVLVLVLFVVWHFYIRFLLPHDKITISLPFAPKDDDLMSMNPMGETVYHPNAPGHPGIDFMWNHPVEMLAVSDARVTSIKKLSHLHPGQEEVFDVEIVNGVYAIRYQETRPHPDLKVGMQLKKGDVLGYGGKVVQGNNGENVHYSVHWEFDYDTPIFDRLCPLTYFDEESLSRINSIWSKAGNTFNGQFMEICSGSYSGKDE